MGKSNRKPFSISGKYEEMYANSRTTAEQWVKMLS